jgi:hypothetical protein
MRRITRNPRVPHLELFLAILTRHLGHTRSGSVAVRRLWNYAQPSSFSVWPSFQIFGMWRILSPSKRIT